MNRINRLSIPLSLMLLLIILSAVYSAPASAVSYFKGDTMVTENGYEYYRAWSQDQYPWHNSKPSDAWESDWMNLYGCSTVAMAKMFVEANVADPYTFDPGTLMSDYGSPSKGIGDVGIYWSTLASQFGMTCESYQCYPSGSFYSTAMNFFQNSGKQYHLLLKVTPAMGGSHYLHVDRLATMNAGEIIINNSTNCYDGTARYSSADEYFQNVALQKLTSTSYSPDYFVVFSHKDEVKLKSAEAVDNKEIKLTWYPSGACQKYVIYRREKGEDTWTGKKLATVKAVPGEGLKTYTDKTAAFSTEYEYTVRGCYSSDAGTTYIKYNKKGLSVTLSSPAPVLTSAESVNHKTIKLTWEKDSNSSAYRVYRKQSGTSWESICDKTTDTSFVDKTAKCGIKYTYTVRGFDKENSKLGAWNNKGISATALPEEVTLKKAVSVDFNQIKVTWKKLEDMDGYALYRKAPSEKNFKKIAEVEGVSTTEAIDESTLTGEAYTYTVKAYKTVNGKNVYGSYNAQGISGTSCTQAPKITNTISNRGDTLKIHWTQVNGATGYIVYRSAKNADSFAKVGTVSGNGNTVFVDSKLECCVKYYYKVKAYRERDGKKYTGFTSKAYHGYTHPAIPTIKTAESENYKTIKLKWDKVAQATNYMVYRKDDSSMSLLTQVDGDSVAYKDKTAKTGVEYAYAVRAVCSKNGMMSYSDYSSQVSAKAYPSTPVPVKAESKQYDEIDFQWSEVKGSTGYVVYRKDPNEKQYSYLNMVEGQKNVTIKDTSVICGEKYSYTVKAFTNVDGVSYYSDNHNGISATAKLATPEVDAECANYNTINVAWTKIKGADGYRVYYRKGAAKEWSKLGTFENSNLTSCSHSSLETGTEYHYTVRAFRKEGKKTLWSDCRHDGAWATPQTAEAKLLSAKSTAYNTVAVKWEAVEGASGYRVYRKASTDTKWTSLKAVSAKKLKYTDSTAVCGNTYKYTVRSYRTVNGKNIYGLYNKKGISVKLRPDTPVVTASVTAYNKIKLKWKVCNGADSYRVYRSTAGGSYELVKELTTTSYKDKVECGVEYKYYVTSVAVINDKKLSSAKSKAVEAKAVPDTPVLTGIVSDKTGTVDITWERVTGASGYYIYRKDANGEYKLIYDNIPGSNCTFTDVSLKSGESYTYTVSAFRICTAGYIEGGCNTEGLTVKVK